VARETKEEERNHLKKKPNSVLGFFFFEEGKARMKGNRLEKEEKNSPTSHKERTESVSEQQGKVQELFSSKNLSPRQQPVDMLPSVLHAFSDDISSLVSLSLPSLASP